VGNLIEKSRAEAIVVGGGVIGLSIARELRKGGLRSVIVVEKGRCGEEASWAAAGMLSPQVEADDDGAFLRFCCESRDLYPEFVAKLEAETRLRCDFDQTGTLYIALDADQERELDRRFAGQTDLGLAVEKLDQRRALSLEGSLNPRLRAALRFPNDWQIDNRKLMLALRTSAELSGIQILEGTLASRIETAGGQVAGLETADGVITAPIVVLATGAWSSLIDIEGRHKAIDIIPIRGQIIAFQPSRVRLRHVVYGPDGYVLPRSSGRILAGATTEEAGFEKAITDEAKLQLSRMAGGVMPSLADQSIVDQWSGLRPRTADDLPVLGSMGIEGLMAATGHYRNGILLAPITARIVADSILGRPKSVYLEHFSPARFSPERANMAKV
jgi:glycine oxidase